MNRNERILSMALILFFGYFGIQWVVKTKIIAPLKAKDAELSDLMVKLEQRNKDLLEAQNADLEIKNWNKQSLPYDTSVATTEYTTYLKGIFKQVGMANAEIKPSRFVPVALPGSKLNAYRKLPFQVEVKTDLVKLTKFLYAFDKEQTLSQVRSLHIKPEVEKDGSIRDYSVDLHIEALSLPLAIAKTEVPKFKPKPENSTDSRPLDDYAVIAKKNIFQPTKIVKVDVPPPKREAVATVTDDTKDIYIVHTEEIDNVGEIWIKNTKESKSIPIKQGEYIKVNGFNGKLVEVKDNVALIQVGKDIGPLRLGQNLAAWKATSSDVGNTTATRANSL